MKIELEHLAKRIGISTAELEVKLSELGFEYDVDTGVEEDIADLVAEELKAGDIADVYDELIAEEMEREIVKSQRKQTVGKEKKYKDKRQDEELAGNVLVEVGDTISVKEFAEKSGISPAKVIGELMKNGLLANINQQIDYDTLAILAEEFGVKLERKRGDVDIKDVMQGNLDKLLEESDPEKLEERPPVVTVMGHVDHGKTKLLDYLRNTNVVAGESGGITQHIGAYQVVKNDRKITFLDTPGHEAFTAMRARGAKATDIAILVIAGDDGMKPQTVEALNHAKDANVPIIVAITKMDKPDVNVDRIKAQIAEHGLQPEDWGGKTIVVPVSAMTGSGMDTLLEMILLTADLLGLKANPNRPAVGTVIEAHLDQGLGPVATILINTGTLNVMDPIIIGSAYGRVKLMKDHTGKKHKSLFPSDTALIAGLSKTPMSGDILQVVQSEKDARTKASSIQQIEKVNAQTVLGMSLNEIVERIKEGKLRTLKVVLKADTQGSIEAITESLMKVKGDNVGVRVIHSGVGNISESDVNMCLASQAVILGFHVSTPPQVDRLAEANQVQILHYTIIYQLLDEVKKLLTGLLEPEVVEVELGELEVKGIFYTKGKEMIIGGKVLTGVMQNKAKLKVFRNDEMIGEGLLSSLKKVDTAVDEVKVGNECGIKFDGRLEIQIGDILKAFKKEVRMKTLEN